MPFIKNGGPSSSINRIIYHKYYLCKHQSSPHSITISLISAVLADLSTMLTHACCSYWQVTGSGKTLAFVIPVVEMLLRRWVTEAVNVSRVK